MAAGVRIISPLSRHSKKVCSIASGLLFSFSEKFAQKPTRSCWLEVVLIFNICNVYEIFALNWLYSHYWGRVNMVGMASKFLGNIKNWCFFSLLVRLIWFCETAKLYKSALSNFKKWPDTNHSCIDVWRETTRSRMHFPSIWTFQNLKVFPRPQPWSGLGYPLKHGIFVLQNPYHYYQSLWKGHAKSTLLYILSLHFSI